MAKVSRRRHVVKAVTWRILATTITILLVWMVTGNWAIGAQIGVLEFFVKMVAYYGHERAWYHFIRFGVEENVAV